MNLTCCRIFFFFPFFPPPHKVANVSRYPLHSDGNIVLLGGGELVCGRRCEKIWVLEAA